jgi:nucleotide-binding universal stress UspA family protein
MRTARMRRSLGEFRRREPTMRKVLAALDASAAARPVIETACGVGQLVDAEVEALHVGDRRVETLDALATQYEVTLRVIESRDVTARVLDAVEAADPPAARPCLSSKEPASPPSWYRPTP